MRHRTCRCCDGAGEIRYTCPDCHGMGGKTHWMWQVELPLPMLLGWRLSVKFAGQAMTESLLIAPAGWGKFGKIHVAMIWASRCDFKLADESTVRSQRWHREDIVRQGWIKPNHQTIW